MHPDGLSAASRIVAWNSFVLPHVLYYLPFLPKLQMHRIDSVTNTTLRLSFDTRASSDSLRAEFGLLTTEALWAQSLARMHGRLHTNHVRMRAATVYCNLTEHWQAEIHHSQRTLTAIKIALHSLQLSLHWPHLTTQHLAALDEPCNESHPGAAASAPWRRQWGLLVERQSLQYTNLSFARLLLTPDHRLRSYLSESLASLPATPSRAAKASWLQLQLSRGAQTTLLKLRALASDLASHISERARRGNNEYEESFCPICARSTPKPNDADMFEDLHHLTTSCQQLSTQQTPLHLAAAAEITKLGGLRLQKAGPVTAWPALPTLPQTALLLGNPVPALLFTIPDESDRKAWRASFLESTLPHIRTLFKARQERIAVLYPPTSSSDHAQHKTRRIRTNNK
jgi:hypothetical protein